METKVKTVKNNLNASKAKKVETNISIDETILKSLDNINLSNEVDKIAPTKLTNDKRAIDKKYKYKSLIENYNSLDNSEKVKKEKRLRIKIRKQTNSFLNNILYYFSKKEKDNLINEAKKFDSFYKENYSLNDYSVNSFVDNRSSVEKEKTIIQVLKILGKY